MAEIWGAAIAVGGSLLAGAASGAAQSHAQDKQNQLTQEDQELNFQRQDYLAQQQRLWQLQDRQYKQQSIGGFDKFWTPSGVTPPNQNAQMGQLDTFDPNKLGSVGPLPAAPGAGATAALPPLGQLAPPRTTIPMQPT